MAFIREIAKNRQLYVLAIPGIVFLAIFSYIPMFGHLIAFERFQPVKGIWGSKWVGLDNFKFFFGGQDWLRVTFNTVYLNLLFLIFGIGFAIILAILINEIGSTVIKKISQSLIFLPYFISWLVVSLMILAFMSTDGLMNNWLKQMNIDSINWYQRVYLWPLILTLVYVWKFAGYYSIIFLAAIVGISSEYYESAKIDGATRVQQIIHITIPSIRSVIVVLMLLGVGRIFFGDFGMIYGIIGDNSILYPTTDVIDTYSFRALRQLGNFGMSSAVVFYQSIMGLFTILIFNRIAKKIDPDSSLF
ncbi:ABC transporter permease subunit [Paenibacillus alginolyticus]|uniref:ABC transporter permease subunit n=1 Tax=Paenibacillus alginolyticus TaxID=59839 RepID=A0ABT4GGB6_9BACL|nr:ABC transporter permease subunit [Paenibacillus alginolyticus]MCY9670724.1 ABC transporter permease subunit [Paenibacillus alginolyticus]MCY9695124.1 ABC transporter permease subunit [Paenibacillus alginolyticus]MEC0147943.1 ABC transporter permease subunit [Paenibacillus alginolyticus]